MATSSIVEHLYVLEQIGSGCFRVVSGLRDKIRVDIQCVNVTVGPSPRSDFNCRMTRHATEIANYVPQTNVRRFIKNG